jgi:peroxiredoxin
MAQFEPFKNEIEQAGSELLFIAAEKRSGMFKPAKFLAKHPVSFPFLLDEDRTVTRAYGVYHRLGHDAIHIARPATLVIDDRGVVQFIYRGANQTDRIPVAAVLEVLKKLSVRRPS